MKKLYFIAFIMSLLASFGIRVSAYEVTYRWNIPGAIELHENSATGALIQLADDATEYTYTNTESGSFYAIAKPGYIITKIVAAGVEQKVPAPSNYGSVWGPFITESNASKYSPAEITLEEVEYNIPMKLTIENGANDIYMQYGPLNKRREIANGEQTVYFSKYDTNCYIGGQNGLASADIYNIEVNGEKLTLPYSFSTQYQFTPVENAEIKIRAYEGEEVVRNKYILSFEAPEGAVISVFDRTTSGGLITDLTEENLTFNEGDLIQVNFNPDFEFTTLTVNGEDYLEELYSNNISFKITADTKIKAEGAVKQYGTVEFTAYVINPEGVKLYQGGYQQNLFEGAATETTSEDITVGDCTFPAGTTYILHPVAGEKNPQIFVEANDGWYIKTVLAADEPGSSSFGIQTGAINSEYNGTTFYVIAEKYETPAKLDIIVPASGYMFRCNPALSQNWENPMTQYSLKEGRNTISYLPGYHDPFNFAFTEEAMVLYVDGVAQEADENGRYQLAPVFDAATGVYSTAIVVDGTAKTYAVTFKGDAIAAGDIYYGTARKAVTLDSNNRTTVLAGMVLGFKLPEGSQAVVATQNDSKTYTSADADAAGYIVITPEASTVVTVEAAASTSQLVPVILNPSDGAVVRSISTVKVMVAVPENYDPYNMDEDALSKITLTAEDGAVCHPAALGDVGMTSDESMYEMPLLFEPAITEAGKYTLTIPAEVFYQTSWDEESQSFKKPEGSYANAAVTAEYTVDPSVISGLSKFTLTPASESTVGSIETIFIDFPDLARSFNAITPEALEITNGVTVHTCAVALDWTKETLCFKIVPVDADYEPVVISEFGDWTLTIPAGSFQLDGDSNPEIIAKYTIGEVESSYILDPSTDSTVFNLGTIKVTFKNATEITYNDEIITLENDDFSAEADYVDYDGNVATLYFTAPEEAGDYTLTVPAGSFTVDGNPSELITAVYHFEPAYVLNPAPMSQIENVSDITISFPAFTNVEFVGDAYQVLAMAGMSSAIFLEAVPVEGADVPTFKFLPADETAQLPNGLITLNIEEGVFSLDGTASPAVKAYYNLSGPVSTDWTVSPDKCIIYDEFFIGGTIVFDENVSVSRGENYDNITISLNDTPLSLTDNVGIEANYFMINVFENIALGELKVHIPAGALSLSGTPCTEIDYTWTIIENREFDCVITPGAGDVTNLSTVTVEFPTATSADVFLTSGVFMRSTDYDYKCSFTGVIEQVEDAEHPTFRISFSNSYGVPSKLTDYVLQISAGTFTLDEYYSNEEVNVNYTLNESSGIEDILAGENGEVTIYTLQGIKLNVEWKNLPAGFYIVNGKKVYKNN